MIVAVLSRLESITIQCAPIMPVADRKLIGWAVVIYIVAAVAVCGTTTYTCHAPSEYGIKNIVICNVTYTDTLVLECPDPSQKAALWRRVVNNSSAIVCSSDSGPKCTLNVNRNLTNQDSGIYFCRIPTANGSDLSYVKVNTLAPPSLLGVLYCDEHDSSSCSYPALVGDIHDRFTVTVAWDGMEPFSVQWKHNDSHFNCHPPHCDPKQSANKMSLVFLANPHPDDFPGVYSANVSNSYGWNMSHTDIIINRCPAPSPVPTSHNSSKALTDGSSKNLTCNLTYTSEAWLTVCYGKFNQRLSDFTDRNTSNQYCTFCYPRGSGNCGSLPPKPAWEVYREEEGSCEHELVNVIAIRNFAKEDEGRIFCFYGDDDNPYKLYTTYTLTYKSYTLYIAIGVGCMCVMILITVVVCVIWRKKKSDSKDSDSPSIPSIIVRETHSIPAAQTESSPLLMARPPRTPDGSCSILASSNSYSSTESTSPPDTDWPEQLPSSFLNTERNGRDNIV